VSRWGVYEPVRFAADGKRLSGREGVAARFQVSWRVDSGNPRRRSFKAKGHADTWVKTLREAAAGGWAADSQGWPIDPAKAVAPTTADTLTVREFAEAWWVVRGGEIAADATRESHRLNLDLLLSCLDTPEGVSRPIAEALTLDRLNTAIVVRRATHKGTRAWNERETVKAFNEGRVPKLRVEACSPNTERSFRVTLGMLLTAAVVSGHLPKNPMKDLTARRSEGQPVTLRLVLSIAQVIRLSELVAAMPGGERYRALILLAGTTGLRPGELVALRMEDIELDPPSPRLSITETERNGERRPLKHRRKDEIRHVPLAPIAVAALRAHIAAGHPNGERVFTSPEGEALDLGNWTPRYWHTATAQLTAETRKVCPEGMGLRWLRKTAITWWLQSGVDVYQAAKWAGHSAQVLLTDYAGVIDDSPAAAVAKLEANTPTAKG
jgi:integrase